MTKSEELEQLQVLHKVKRAEIRGMKIFTRKIQINVLLTCIGCMALIALSHFITGENIRHIRLFMLGVVSSITGLFLLYLELRHRRMAREYQRQEDEQLAQFQLSLVETK